MSGGRFNYLQYRITDIYESIESIIRRNRVEKSIEEIKKENPGEDITKENIDYYKYDYNFSDKTIEEFKKGVELLKKAQVYAQRIDWLLSGDDGEETFHERLKEDLKNQKQ